jgi:DNA-directed RNA polymerase specialized sigma24 family protein
MTWRMMVNMSKTQYTAHAKRVGRRWKLHVDSVGVTYANNLERAPEMVCDLIESVIGQRVDEAQVFVKPDLSGLEQQVERARRDRVAAQTAQERAAESSRALVVTLQAEGFSVTDIAAVLGVSRTRVFQLYTKP